MINEMDIILLTQYVGTRLVINYRKIVRRRKLPLYLSKDI